MSRFFSTEFSLRRVFKWGGAAVVLFGAFLAAVACGYVALPFGLTVNFSGFTGAPIPEPELSQRLHLPEGFQINTYAGGIDNARMLRFTAAGDLLVSSPRTGTVVLLERDRDGDGYADGQRVLLPGLYQPHGLDVHDGWLYVAEGDAVLRVRFDAATGAVSGAPERIIKGIPAGGNHWTRTVRVGPDQHLYVSIGSTCNACIEKNPQRATIMRYGLDGSGGAIYASGLRNSVGFDWQPGSGDLYATDNGTDLLGDDFPPCELNRIVEGGFYGWPFANGDRVPYASLADGHAAEIAASIAPAHGFGAHTAPLGMTFYRPPAAGAAATFPAAYHGAAFVAQHGSWNRSQKSGYQVVALSVRPDGTISEAPFLTGFVVDDQAAGRPVDAAVGPDGALYVSDDYTGAVYRIAYGQAARGRSQATAATPHGDPLAALDRGAIAAASARGAALWEANGCAACHVAGQAAGDSYRRLSALGARYTIDSLVVFLRTPQPPMPAYPFSDEERRDLAVYLLATHP
ncbi:MAG: PQQ-dependent sugar dehydrogenase [Candidatus Binatia bacterium]